MSGSLIASHPPARLGRPAALPGLTVVLPCLDEAENVAAAVAAAGEAASRHAREHEIVVVDDGSTDDTRAIADALALADPRVRVIAHERNRGYGAALRSGIAASTMPWILLTDADLQFDLMQLGELVEEAGDHDLVCGRRVARQDPLHRRLSAHGWNLMSRRTFGTPVRDVDCAFKLVRGELARGLGLRSEGAMVSAELLARASDAGWRIAERDVRHYPRQAGRATGGDVRVIVLAFRERRALVRALRDDGVRPEHDRRRPRLALARRAGPD